MNKLFTVLGRKFKYSAQDSDLKYLIWRSKNPPVSSDLKPPLVKPVFYSFIKIFSCFIFCDYLLQNILLQVEADKVDWKALQLWSKSIHSDMRTTEQ